MFFFVLASSKHKIIELEQQVNSLTMKLVESDQEKEQMKLELRSANMSLQDVQQKLHTLQVPHILWINKLIEQHTVNIVFATPDSPDT